MASSFKNSNGKRVKRVKRTYNLNIPQRTDYATDISYNKAMKKYRDYRKRNNNAVKNCRERKRTRNCSENHSNSEPAEQIYIDVNNAVYVNNAYDVNNADYDVNGNDVNNAVDDVNGNDIRLPPINAFVSDFPFDKYYFGANVADTFDTSYILYHIPMTIEYVL